MDMDFLNKLNDIHSFVLLQEIFESWVKDGTINEKTSELRVAYASLINFPSIFLTEDGAENEIAAAKVCHSILTEHAAKNIIEKALSSNDEKYVAMTMLLPPEKYILSICKYFFQLHYLLKGLFGHFTNEHLANIDGDDYAKVWLNIFSNGYNLKPIKQQIDKNQRHLTEALRIILKMHLSPQYREQLNPRRIDSQLTKYYNNKEGNGCMATILVFLFSSIMITYCI